MTFDPALRKAYESITTATITTILLKKGLRNVGLRGPKPLRGGPSATAGRLVGPAFTLRFVPAREDLATPASWSSPTSTRAAIEEMPEGGTDGGVRERGGPRARGLPVWCSGGAAPPSVAGLTFVGCQQPVGCGGVAVFPDDLVVCDRDGAVVVPKELITEVAELGLEQERLEAWIMKEVEQGAKLPGLYPINEENRARYEADSARSDDGKD